MNGKETIVDLTKIDPNHEIADLEAIRRHNLQRYEMEQLTAIIYEDPQDRKSTRLNSSHSRASRMPSSA